MMVGHLLRAIAVSFDFFFNDTATTEIYTLSLHDALPILRGITRRPSSRVRSSVGSPPPDTPQCRGRRPRDSVGPPRTDRKSTRLNSSHANISYAVFCLQKKQQDVTLAALLRQLIAAVSVV